MRLRIFILKSTPTQPILHSMKLSRLACVILTTGLFPFNTARGQDTIKNVITMGFGDMAAIRKRAEAGDATAQNALGGALEGRFKSSEAILWYRRAAKAGNVEAAFNLGRMLMFGGVGLPETYKVRANPVEGIQWTYIAATNFHQQALYNMSQALQTGLGTTTNIIQAYAWLQLYSETPGGSIVGRVRLNELALKLDSAALQQGQKMAARCKQGQWPPLMTRVLPEGDQRLKLNGITFGTKVSLALINGKSVAVGDSATIPLKPASLRIKCLEINKDSVLISVEGEDAPRVLRLK